MKRMKQRVTASAFSSLESSGYKEAWRGPGTYTATFFEGSGLRDGYPQFGPLHFDTLEDFGQWILRILTVNPTYSGFRSATCIRKDKDVEIAARDLLFEINRFLDEHYTQANASEEFDVVKRKLGEACKAIRKWVD